ncbi:PREDICTED: GATA transcription factor 29-like [Populus euphratica]|uniref:GATA transcription factor 29-like n=1 Tax=Populus euphratica TaxID=75702 RepID=A0AAJ6UZ54_POPEU|nr:PREDICTED: GATA transcription factor 29-like [Populus euphratica]
MVGGPPSSSHGLGNGRPTVPSTQETGSQPHAINLNNNVLNPPAAAADQNSSSMLEVGGYFNTDLLPPATLNNYILLDSSSRDAESGKSPGTHKCRCEICHFHPRKTCLNPLCGTNNTPMWRGGPLGPRTLCNACGIRYKREKVRRRA